jgi:hypothetical protein
MLLWETEFYALSVVTGELESFRGVYIQARHFAEALKIMRKDKLDYLQLTGKWFADAEAVMSDRDFYEKLTDPQNIVKGMSYDEFMEWLDLALCRKDLTSALERFKNTEGMEDYVKILEIYIKNYDEENGSNEDQGSEESLST